MAAESGGGQIVASVTEVGYHPMSFPSLGAIFTAEAIGASYEKTVVDLLNGEQKTPEYLAISPYGKVPALTDGDFKMAESAAIMRYIARRENSDLYPSDIQAQAEIDQWMDYVNHHIRSPVGRVQFNRVVAPMVGAKVDEGSMHLGLQLLSKNLPVLEARLSETAFLCGNTMSLADISLVAALEPVKMAKIDMSPYPTLSAWLDARRSETFYTNIHTHFGAEMGQ